MILPYEIPQKANNKKLVKTDNVHYMKLSEQCATI